jgi:hypothetical protein
LPRPGRIILPALICAGLWLAGLAAAQQISHGSVSFQLPEGWVRLEDTRAATFSPADDPSVTLSIFPDLGDDGAQDALERFVETAEQDETSIARDDVEELADRPFDIVMQRTRVRLSGGGELTRLYAAADPKGADAVIALSGPEAGVARFESHLKALLESLGESETSQAVPARELAGDGGLDGVYMSFGQRLSVSAGTGRWTDMRRAEVLSFEPLGQVHRGGAERAGVALFDGCERLPAWRCGRYRVEGDHISLRWNDGTSERRSLQILESSLLIGGLSYDEAPVPDAGQITGVHVFADLFNAGDWPVPAEASDGDAPSIRFIEGGKFSLSGFTRVIKPRFGKDISSAGRYRIAGGEITLVYRSGAIEVLSVAGFDDNGQRGLMIGGRAFNVSDQ